MLNSKQETDSPLINHKDAPTRDMHVAFKVAFKRFWNSSVDTEYITHGGEKRNAV